MSLHKVSLQSHESAGSYDSITPLETMVEAYEDAGFTAVGFVGHDNYVDVSDVDTDLLLLSGIEHTVDRQNGVYVAEFPKYDFQYLVRPSYKKKGISKEEVHQIAQEHSVDAVEKYTDGLRQYRGELPLLELADDGAHNTSQIGSSYMIVESDSPTKDEIMHKIQSGDFEKVNHRRSVIGQLKKGLAVLHSWTQRIIDRSALARKSTN